MALCYLYFFALPYNGFIVHLVTYHYEIYHLRLQVRVNTSDQPPNQLFPTHSTGPKQFKCDNFDTNPRACFVRFLRDLMLMLMFMWMGGGGEVSRREIPPRRESRCHPCRSWRSAHWPSLRQRLQHHPLSGRQEDFINTNHESTTLELIMQVPLAVFSCKEV